jgi:hypothetical protein
MFLFHGLESGSRSRAQHFTAPGEALLTARCILQRPKWLSPSTRSKIAKQTPKNSFSVWHFFRMLEML